MTRTELELAGKLVSALGLVVLHAGLWRIASRWRAEQVEKAAWSVWLLTRPGLFVLAFGVLGLPVSSDAALKYLPEGLAALDGKLVYRDFSSSYGPLFPYAVGLLLAIAKKPETLVLAAIGFEGLAMYAWPRAAAASVDERARADGLLLYACSPIAVWTTTLAGHNQSWLSFALALSFTALAHGAWARSAAWLVAGAALVKALALAPAAYLMLLAARHGRMSLMRAAFALGLGALIVLGPFALLGAPVWKPVVSEGLRTTSGNLPYLLGFAGIDPGQRPVAYGLLAALAVGLIAASVLAARRVSLSRGAHHAALCLVMLVLLLLSKKAYTTYLVIFWLPMCLVLASQKLSGRVVLGFSIFSVIATIEPALWFDWLGQATLSRALSQLGTEGAPSGGQLALFIVCELALIGGYAWLLCRAARALVPSGAQTSAR